MSTFTAVEFNSLTRTQKIELVKRWLDQKPIYVRYKESSAMREGAIAKISRWPDVAYALTKNGDQMASRYRYGYMTAASASTPVEHVVGKDKYEINVDHLSSHWFKVTWDGRSNHVDASAYEIELLIGYEGPCVWQWGKKEKPQVLPYDRLGREVKVGDFACYILHHFGTCRGASTQFGTVQKIERDGTVWAKNVALSDGEKSQLKRINDNATIVILTSDLMDRLMLAKLASL